jgi:23S rRNA (pseudouridine1915-N3)-methyltransferase
MNHKIRLIAVGKVKRDWVVAGLQEYTKRLPGLTIVEIKDSTPEQECDAIAAQLKPQDQLIVLTERGMQLDSPGLAQFLQQQVRDHTLVFAIGGPAGVSPRLEQQADHTLALSVMTFPHEVARLLLVEQLYRAQTILQHGKYHK